MKNIQFSKKQKGVTLLEVLISVLVLAIGVLGIAGLQSVSLRSTQSANEKVVAILQTETLFEIMRANIETARNGGYAMTCNAPVAGTQEWLAEVRRATDATVCPTVTWNNGVYTVTINWTDQRLNTNSVVVMEMRP